MEVHCIGPTGDWQQTNDLDTVTHLVQRAASRGVGLDANRAHHQEVLLALDAQAEIKAVHVHSQL